MRSTNDLLASVGLVADTEPDKDALVPSPSIVAASAQAMLGTVPPLLGTPVNAPKLWDGSNKKRDPLDKIESLRTTGSVVSVKTTSDKTIFVP